MAQRPWERPHRTARGAGLNPAVVVTLFDKTASALVHTIAAQHDRCPTDRRRGPCHPIAAFVRDQVAHMTAPLRPPMRLATCGLSVLAFIATGRAFHRLPEIRRTRLVARWRASRVGPIRDVVRFYDSLTVLALYSDEGD